MRVISGKAGGLKLETIEGLSTRPTTDRVKESLFNIIQFDIPNKNVLDLFAGSGALGIESASRGAKKVRLVENNFECQNIIKKNIIKTKLDNVFLTIKDSFVYLEATDEKFDIIFLDPPYMKGFYDKAISLILKYNILNNNGIVVLEIDKKDKINLEISGLTLIKNKKYGNTKILIYRRTL